MEPVIHPSNNLVLKSPEGVADCEHLPATRCLVNSTPSIVTFWRPSAEELEQLNSGLPVALVVYNQSMPMVWVAVGNIEPPTQQ